MIRRRHPLLAPAAALLLAVAAAPAPAGDVPIGVPLRRAETAHFVYVLDAALEPDLARLARLCEETHALLSPVFRWTPREKTIVFYVDSQDDHNGWATVFPRPTILLLAADAYPASTIFEPGDYLRRTFLHEYTHLLMSDAQYGADAVLARAFGRVVTVGDPLSALLMLAAAPPGALAPDWYQEGFSIWSETEFSDHGRGRSTRVDMVLRVAAAEGRLLDATQWALEHPQWPYGEAAYLYGMKCAEYIHATWGSEGAGRNVPGELADAVSHSFMFGFNSRAFDVVDRSFRRLTEETLACERERQAARLAALRAQPLTVPPRLTPRDLQVTSPVFGPGTNTLFFAGMAEADRSMLYRCQADGTRLGGLDAARTTHSPFARLATAGERATIYYTRLDVQGRDRLRSEIIAFDTRTGAARRACRDGRYRSIAASPDGRRVAAVVDRAARQRLVEFELRDGAAEGERTLAEAGPGRSLADPAYAPDGERILFVEAGEGGAELKAVETATGAARTLLAWPCMILHPAVAPSGAYALFTADRSGVFNLYRLALADGAEAAPVTHVEGGLFEPSFSADGHRVAAVACDGGGYYLTVFDARDLRPLAFPLPVLPAAWAQRPANVAARREAERAAAASVPAAPATQAYRSGRELRFDFWSPWLTATGDGAAGGLYASFSDPAAFQGLEVLAGAESEYDEAIGSLLYLYEGCYPELGVYASRNVETYSDLVVDGAGVFHDYVEIETTAGLALSVPWPRVDRLCSLTAGWAFTDRATVEEAAEVYARRAPVTRGLFDGAESAAWLRADFFNAAEFPRSHSYEDGRFVTLTADVADESIGGDLNRSRWRGDWNEYVRLPWGANQVLKLQAVYGGSRGDDTAQGAFGLGMGVGVPVGGIGLDRDVDLRGYRANEQVGTEVAKGGVAWRFPLVRAYRNSGPTAPLYWQQVFGEVFYEQGRATGGAPAAGDPEWLRSAGLEVNGSMTLGRYLGVAPGFGAAYAFDREPRPGEEDDDSSSRSKLQYYITVKGVVSF